MKVFPKYSKKAQIKIGFLLGIILLLVFIGGNIWFKNSDEWKKIQKLIILSPVVISYVGNVEQVSLSFFGVSYEFSGDYAEANLDVEVVGEKAVESFHVIAKRKRWKWSLANVSKN